MGNVILQKPRQDRMLGYDAWQQIELMTPFDYSNFVYTWENIILTYPAEDS